MSETLEHLRLCNLNNSLTFAFLPSWRRHRALMSLLTEICSLCKQELGYSLQKGRKSLCSKLSEKKVICPHGIEKSG